MLYVWFLILLIVILASSIVWMYLSDSEGDFFKKGNIKIFLLLFLIFFTLGSGRLMVRKPLSMPPEIYSWVVYTIFLIFGFILLGMLNKKFSWAWGAQKSLNKTIPLVLLLLCFSAFAFFLSFWMFEEPVFKAKEGIADNYTMGLILSVLPFSVMLAHYYWNKIPVVEQEFFPYIPDLQKEEKFLIESDKQGLRFSIQLPRKYGKIKDIETIPIIAPRENSLHQVFFNALWEHNEKAKRSRQVPIEVKVNSDGEKVYGWVFFRAKKKWWWVERYYIDPYEPFRRGHILPNEVIFADRIKTW